MCIITNILIRNETALWIYFKEYNADICQEVAIMIGTDLADMSACLPFSKFVPTVKKKTCSVNLDHGNTFLNTIPSSRFRAHLCDTFCLTLAGSNGRQPTRLACPQSGRTRSAWCGPPSGRSRCRQATSARRPASTPGPARADSTRSIPRSTWARCESQSAPWREDGGSRELQSRQVVRVSL